MEQLQQFLARLRNFIPHGGPIIHFLVANTRIGLVPTKPLPATTTDAVEETLSITDPTAHIFQTFVSPVIQLTVESALLPLISAALPTPLFPAWFALRIAWPLVSPAVKIIIKTFWELACSSLHEAVRLRERKFLTHLFNNTNQLSNINFIMNGTSIPPTQNQSLSSSSPLRRFLLYGGPIGRFFFIFNTSIGRFLSRFLPSKPLGVIERLTISNKPITQILPTRAPPIAKFVIKSILFPLFDTFILATPLAPLWNIIKIAWSFIKRPVIWVINTILNAMKRYALGKDIILLPSGY